MITSPLTEKKSFSQPEIDNKTFESFSIPNSIYKRTFNNLIDSHKVSLIMSNGSLNGKCFWAFGTFSKNNKNKVSTIINKTFIDCEKLIQIKSLYQKLNKIEKNNSIAIAEKYLDGYLEYHCMTLDEMIEKISLLTA